MEFYWKTRVRPEVVLFNKTKQNKTKNVFPLLFVFSDFMSMNIMFFLSLLSH